MLTASHGTLISCNYLGDSSLQVIGVSCIKSVVAMVPHKLEKHCVEDNYHFLVERPRLDVIRLGSGEDDLS